MITPTLFDVAFITGLQPTGKTFDPTKVKNSRDIFDFQGTGVLNFITENMGTEPEVSDTEHIAFLTYWLTFFVFCSSSLQVTVRFSNLAIQLHRGEDIGLGRLILATLYESLNVASIDIKLPQDGNEFLLTSGPLWLLQFWLNATFQHKINQDVPFDTPRNIEGIRLNLVTPEADKVSTTEAFDIWFRMFSQQK